MQIARQEVVNAMQTLPEHFDVEEAMYRLYVLDKIHKGQRDIEEGHTLTADELRREMDQW